MTYLAGIPPFVAVYKVDVNNTRPPLTASGTASGSGTAVPVVHDLPSYISTKLGSDAKG